MIELRRGTETSILELSTQKPLDIMLNLSQIKHVWQDPDSCGSAVSVIGWKTLVALGVKSEPAPEQSSIHQQIFDPVWDGSRPESIEKYLVENGIKAELLKNQTLADVKKLLDQDKILITLITDDFPTVDDDPPSGHYVIIQNIDKDYATLVDPSNAERYYSDDGVVSIIKNGYTPEKRPNYKIKINDLDERFHDEVAPGVDGRGYVIAIDTKK